MKRRYMVKLMRHTVIWVEVDAEGEKEARDAACDMADEGLISDSYIYDAVVDGVEDIPAGEEEDD